MNDKVYVGYKCVGLIKKGEQGVGPLYILNSKGIEKGGKIVTTNIFTGNSLKRLVDYTSDKEFITAISNIKIRRINQEIIVNESVPRYNLLKVKIDLGYEDCGNIDEIKIQRKLHYEYNCRNLFIYDLQRDAAKVYNINDIVNQMVETLINRSNIAGYTDNKWFDNLNSEAITVWYKDKLKGKQKTYINYGTIMRYSELVNYDFKNQYDIFKVINKTYEEENSKFRTNMRHKQGYAIGIMRLTLYE